MADPKGSDDDNIYSIYIYIYIYIYILYKEQL
jgi:hypothetical protein